jgi:hypothetical protein
MREELLKSIQNILEKWPSSTCISIRTVQFKECQPSWIHNKSTQYEEARPAFTILYKTRCTLCKAAKMKFFFYFLLLRDFTTLLFVNLKLKKNSGPIMYNFWPSSALEDYLWGLP